MKLFFLLLFLVKNVLSYCPPDCCPPDWFTIYLLLNILVNLALVNSVVVAIQVNIELWLTATVTAKQDITKLWVSLLVLLVIIHGIIKRKIISE